MKSIYGITVNGVFFNKVLASPDTTKAEFMDFVRIMGFTFDETKDVLEVECLDSPVECDVRQFPSNAFMQISRYAIEVHLKNMLVTYGEEAVSGVFNELVKTSKVA